MSRHSRYDDWLRAGRSGDQRSKAWICGRSLPGVAGSNTPIPVAVQCKAKVCGRSLAGIAGSNPAGGIVVLCVLYNKDKRQSQDKQDKAVQIKYRHRTKKIPPGAWISGLYVHTKGKM